MTKFAPSRCGTKNWKPCSDVLKRRCSLLVWLDKDMIWLAPRAGRHGCSPVFSDAAVQFCLMVKVLFGLPLRHATEMVASVLQMVGPRPDFSTLGR